MKNILSADLDYILRKTPLLWDEFRNQSIFITGGTGFIGTWLLETFAWANQVFSLNLKVTVLTRSSQQFAEKAPHLFENPHFSFVNGDVIHFDFPAGKFSHVIHAAAGQMFNTTLLGTQHVLQFAESAQTRKFLYVSSGAVYGRQPDGISHISEDYINPSEDINDGAAKLAAEELCVKHAFRHRLDLKIARCFTFVGPYMQAGKDLALINFIRDGLQKKRIEAAAGGIASCSYQYAAEMVIWLLSILVKGRACVPYNVGSSEAVSVGELARIVAKYFYGVRVVDKPVEVPNPPERYVPSVQRSYHDLGLVNAIRLDEAIAKTVAWYKATMKEEVQPISC